MNTSEYMTTGTACKKLGISRQRLWQKANLRGIKPLSFGPMVNLWHISSVKAIGVKGKPGRKSQVETTKD